MKKVIFFGSLLCFSTFSIAKNFNHFSFQNEIVSIFGEDENEILLNLEKESKVSIKIFDLQGGLVKSIKNNVTMKAGQHHLYVSLREFKLKKGSYYRKVSVNGKVKKVKLITI